MTTLVSRAKVAAALGITRQSLEKLIREGKVSERPNPNGKRPKTVLDLAQARREYAKNTDPGKRAAAQKQTKSGGKTQKKRAYGRAGADKMAPQTDAEGTSPAQVPGGMDYNRARTFKTAIEAKMKEAAYKEQIGALMQRDEVVQHSLTLARKLRDRLLGLPARLASYVPKDVMPEIEDEIRDVLAELQEDAASIGR